MTTYVVMVPTGRFSGEFPQLEDVPSERALEFVAKGYIPYSAYQEILSTCKTYGWEPASVMGDHIASLTHLAKRQISPETEPAGKVVVSETIKPGENKMLGYGRLERIVEDSDIYWNEVSRKCLNIIGLIQLGHYSRSPPTRHANNGNGTHEEFPYSKN